MSARGWACAFAAAAIGCGSEPASDECDLPPDTAFVAEQLTDEFLETPCTQRHLYPSDNGTPDDPGDDFAPCTLLEAIHEPAGCRCTNAAGRTPIERACISGRASMDAWVKSELEQEGLCGRTGLPACSEFCVCLVEQYERAEQKQACLNDVDFVASDGWCYVDPLPPPDGLGIGNEAIVEDCPEGRKRKVRYQPLEGAVGFMGCSSAAR